MYFVHSTYFKYFSIVFVPFLIVALVFFTQDTPFVWANTNNPDVPTCINDSESISTNLDELDTLENEAVVINKDNPTQIYCNNFDEENSEDILPDKLPVDSTESLLQPQENIINESVPDTTVTEVTEILEDDDIDLSEVENIPNEPEVELTVEKDPLLTKPKPKLKSEPLPEIVSNEININEDTEEDEDNEEDEVERILVFNPVTNLPKIEKPKRKPAEEVKPVLSSRKFEHEINVDSNAMHSCVANPFKVDIHTVNLVTSTISLGSRIDNNNYEVTIGGLPDGIDVVFAKNNDYTYLPGPEDSVVTIIISKQAGASVGSFNVPIIYTKKGLMESSVVCQINVVNKL